MIEETRDYLGWESFVWRGAFGGASGGLLVMLVAGIYVASRFGMGTFQDLLVFGGVFSVIGGAVTGLAVGFVIWRVACKRGKQLSAVLRIVVGSSCVLIYSLLVELTKSGPSRLLFTLGYAISVGGLAGLLAKAKFSSAGTENRVRGT
jgi:hypothetical protein